MASGQITSGDFVYTLTAEDLDAASRMIANEGGDRASDLWSMAQRFVLYRNHFTSFKAMLQAFSEPLNPKFLADGEFCRPGGRDALLPRCAPAATAHRAIVQAPGTRYPASAAYVAAWAAGLIANPVPRATDFRAADDAARAIVSSGRMSLVRAAGNWYFSTSETDGWEPNHVLVGGRGVGSSLLTGLVVGIGVALAVGLVTWVASEELV